MQPKTLPGILLVCALVILSASSCLSKTVYVRTTGLDTNDGLSWSTAKKTVSAGIAASVSGDEIWVASGTYRERIILNAGVGLYGGFAGTEISREDRDWNTNVTVLNGNGGGTVVTSPSGATASTVIDGFSIRQGRAPSYGGGISCSSSSPTIANNTITANSAVFGGGAIYVRASSPVITNNAITGNTAEGSGGGIYCYSSASPTIMDNVITQNTTSSTFGDTYTGGGGIYCGYSSPTISRNRIWANRSAYNGGGIHCSVSSAIITNNSITDNVGRSGGGVFCYGNSPSLTIMGNKISGNAATTGGAMYCHGIGTLPTIANNTILANTSNRCGGIYLIAVASPRIMNNTIIGNSTSDEGAAISCNHSATPMIANNIIALNSSGIWFRSFVSSTPFLSNNCVYGNTAYDYNGLSAGAGDISADPLFIDPAGSNYRLPWYSPCIDVGTNVGAPPFDMDGYVRPVDGNADGLALADMGAYEYQPIQVTVDVLPGDASNRINMQPNRLITVAVINDGKLDLGAIDLGSILFGPSAAREAHRRGHWEEANGDGVTDLVLHFRCGDTGIKPSDSNVCLYGRLISGEPFIGCDAITVTAK